LSVKVVDYVMNKINSAEQDIRGKKDQWESFYKLYRNYREHLAGEGEANVGLPLAFEWVEVARARLFKEFCGRKPYLRVKGREPMDDIPANRIQVYQNWQYEQARYKQLMYKIITQVLIYGTGICKYYWKHETGNRLQHVPIFPDYPAAGTIPMVQKVPVYDNIAFDSIDLFDFWVDPEGIDIDDASWCADRVRRTIDYLEDKQKEGIYKNIRAVKNDLSKDSSSSESDPYKMVKDIEVEKHLADYGGLMKPIELHTLYEDDRIITIANGKHIIRDIKNIYGKKPFRAAKIISTEHEFYGIGLVEAGASLARLMEDIVNNGLENLNYSVNQERIVDETRISEDSELESKPGNIIHVLGDVNTALKWVDVPDLSPSVILFFNLILEISKGGTGITDYIKGQGKGSDTATEAQLMTTQSALRIDTHIEVMGDTFVGPLAGDVHELNKYFVTDERFIKVTGVGDNPYKMVKVTPDVFGASVDFIWEHEGREMNQMVQVQQLTQVLALAQQTPALWLVAPMIFGKILEQYGYHENEEIMQAISAAKEMAKVMMMGQAMQLGLGGGQGGGGLPNAQRYAEGQSNTNQSMQKKTTPQRGSVTQERK